jgi:hypothetical protein
MTMRFVFLLKNKNTNLIVINTPLPTFTLFDQHKCLMYFKYFISVNMMGYNHA